MKKILLLILCLVVSFINILAQTDTEFWFAAPEVTSGHGDQPIYLRMASFGVASTVTIDQPANPSFTPIVSNIPANGTATVNLTPWKNVCIENDNFVDIVAANYTYVDLKINNYGIHIVATNPITVYYDVAFTNNPDIFTLKGRNALGTLFYIPAQNYMDNRVGLIPDARSSFDIVATEDNTTITIYPTKTIEVNHSTPYSIVLNRGQTYSATAASRLAANHLFGTKVVSDKPVAITIKDDSVYGNTCYDLDGDQLVPVDLLGMDYIAIKGNLTSKEGIIVLATQDNTSIYLDGNPVPVTTINTGQVYKFTIAGAAGTSTFIHTDNPVYVDQVTGYGCETGEAILPPLGCTGSQDVAFTRSNNEPNFSLIIIIKDGAQNNFTLVSGGVNVPVNGASFTAVPGSAGYVAAKINYTTAQVQVGVQTVLSNSVDLFHCGVVYGGNATGCYYGYFSNYNKMSLGDNDITFNGCGYTLDAGPGNSYVWNTGDTTQIITARDSGWYWVIVQIGSCVMNDSIYIAYMPPISLGNDTSVCYGDSIILTAGAGYDYYLWSTGDSGVFVNSITVSGGTYSVTVTDHYGCTSSTSIKIEEGSLLTANINGTDATCTGNTDGIADLTVSGSFFPYSFLWSNGQTVEDLIGISPGSYSVTVSDAISCSITAIVTISEPSALSASITGTNISCFENSDGAADLTVSGGTVPYTYLWNTGQTDEDLTGLAAGTYSVTVTDTNSCTVTSSIVITKPSALLTAYILAINVRCKGGNDGGTDVTVSGGTPPYSFLWNTGVTTEDLTNISIGTYILTVTDANGCTTTASVTITEP